MPAIAHDGAVTPDSRCDRDDGEQQADILGQVRFDAARFYKGDDKAEGRGGEQRTLREHAMDGNTRYAHDKMAKTTGLNKARARTRDW